MAVIINEAFRKKAEELKAPLIKTEIFPESTAEIVKDESAFQGLSVRKIADAVFPIEIKSGEEILFDFGEHFTGYLSFRLNNDGLIKITDSPVKLHFTFGEFPLEIVTPPEDYKGGLGNGWLQNEERSFVFTPCRGTLDRRYSFRYLRLRRTDSASFTIKIENLSLTAVSAVRKENAPVLGTDDNTYKRIYDMSVNTLKECQQEVFEDGPKRDRRLWIGDLKLQAMTDYGVFRNLDLIKRCIYLFASATGEHKMVAPCIFPDSPPYVDEWTFCDYSLFFISCLYDWYKNTGDISLVEELYGVAYTQFEAVSEKFDKRKGEISLNCFIDWCRGLDKSASLLGVYIYTLKQLRELSDILSYPTDRITKEIETASSCLLKKFDEKQGLFTGSSGQISYHSQIWAVLSGVLTKEDAVSVLHIIKEYPTEFTMRTPYMMHYYIEALFNSGLENEALGFIKDIWGQIADAGFDCCPEVFNTKNQFESPYNAPEINSACHAWSCTPAYWLKKLL